MQLRQQRRLKQRRSKPQPRKSLVTKKVSRSPVGGRPPKRYRFRLSFVLFCAAILGFSTGSVASVGLSMMPLHKGDRPAMPATSKIPMQLIRPVNILVMGVDRTGIDQLGLQGNTDTMMLVQFLPKAQRVQALSLPRDTLVDIPGYGRDKLNAANVYGGPALAARSVSQLLPGVKLDRYIRIDTQGLIKLVDALGGVEVNVPKRMYYRDNTQGLTIDFQPGKQHLSGQKLQEYLRFRNDELGDIGRVQRQQAVLKEVKQQFLHPTTILRMPQILHVAYQSIDTNLSMGELLALLGFVQKNQGLNLKTATLPGRFSRPGEYSRSYWIPDLAQIHQMLSSRQRP
ncbi:LCP family protein [filamentous cyanobacterium LEGE 11480]|uniref:LCP family protein n=1 Tax=Romeriopsis navalis LEGE 11480 TaxID=2777977 RepID=A0A928Z1U6_9CYAN|nr:LCP family protein [Romeriopsis navalis]MBE9028382.1 LCP family protein [Romeriopsis navalis LEGE 11480]